MTSSPTASSSCRSPANGNRDMISDKSWGLQCRSGCILCRSKYSVQFIQHQKTCLFPWQKKQTLWRRPIKAKYSWIFLNEKSSQFSESHICHRSLWQSMAVSGCDCLQLEACVNSRKQETFRSGVKQASRHVNDAPSARKASWWSLLTVLATRQVWMHWSLNGPSGFFVPPILWCLGCCM